MATFRQIEIFLQLAETLHFNRAAAELGITQAALSKEIGKLEKELNCRLFDRTDKWNIVLTAAGVIFREKISPLPGMLAEASEFARRAERGNSGRLSVAVANLVYDYVLLQDIFRVMHEKYPEVKIIIHDCQSSPMVYEQLKNGQADVGFMAINNSGDPLPDLRKKPLTELPISLVFPAWHPLARKKDLKIGDLANCNFILPPAEQMPWLRKYIDNFFQEHCGKIPQAEQEAVGLRATRQLVAAGLGIGVTIKPRSQDSRENVVYRNAPFPLKRQIVAAWDENNSSRILKNFVKLLKEVSCR